MDAPSQSRAVELHESCLRKTSATLRIGAVRAAFTRTRDRSLDAGTSSAYWASIGHSYRPREEDHRPTRHRPRLSDCEQVGAAFALERALAEEPDGVELGRGRRSAGRGALAPPRASRAI